MSHYLMQISPYLIDTWPSWPQAIYVPNDEDTFKKAGSLTYSSAIPPYQENKLKFDVGSALELTNVLSVNLTTFKGLLVSSFLLNILKKIKISDHRIFEAEIYRNGKLVDDEFFWIHITSMVNSKPIGCYMDFKSSLFEYVRFGSDNAFETKIESLNEVSQNYKLFYKRKKKLRLKKAVLSDELENLDLFRIGVLHNKFIVSEKLKEELQLNQISSLLLSPYLGVEFSSYEGA